MSRSIHENLARSLVPARPKNAHKGTFGRLLVIAGSAGLTGAASLTCEAALRAGVGAVTLCVPSSLNPAMETRLTETMTRPLPETSSQTLSLAAFDEIAEMAEHMHVVALGPGLSTHPETQELIQRLVGEIKNPLVIDADGLNALEGKTDILTARREPTIISPHPGEMALLAGLPISEVEQKRKKIAAYCASIWRAEVILKGAPSVVAASDGEVYINTTGNSGMATAGSGDTLTGILGALLCQGVTPDAAAVLGTYLHGLAGDCAADRFTKRGMIASDIITCLPEAWRRLK